MIPIEVLETLSQSMIQFFPNIIAACILLFIGWIIGHVIGRITKEILKRLKIDKILFRGRRPILRISGIIPVMISWSIYLLFIQSAVEVLGVKVLVDALGAFLVFLPKLVEAIIIMLAGYAIAEYVRARIEESEVEYASLIAKTIFFLVIYVAIATALPLIGIETFLINALLLVLVGSVGAGVAIAIGLGLKDEVKRFVRAKRARRRRR
jgi:hypothetical protein